MDGLNSWVDIDGRSDPLTLESLTVHSVDSDECIKVHYVVPATQNMNVILETPRPTGLPLGATSNLTSTNSHGENVDVHCSIFFI